MTLKNFQTLIFFIFFNFDLVVRFVALDRVKNFFFQFRSVAWRPSPHGTYESTPPSPRCFEKAEKAEKAMAANPVRKKYVPPGMRNSPNSTSSATAALNGLRDTGSDVVGRVQSKNSTQSSLVKTTPKPQRQLLVGEVAEEDEEIDLTAESKNRKKNQKKKEKQRQKKEEEERKAEEARQKEAAREAELEKKFGNDPAGIEKRLKKLRKKMRQVDALKEKDRATLLPEQRAKLDEEASLFRLIAELEQSLEQAKK
jgi:hypothetical protein